MRIALLRSRRLARLRGVVIVLALGAGAGAASATPEGSADPVLLLLAEKGLLPVAAVAAQDSVAVAPAAAPSLLRTAHDRASGMVVSAMNFLGVRYRKGGSSAVTGFDCSGFTRHVFDLGLGLTLPRRADEQATSPGLTTVARADLRPGDLVFFNTLKRTFSHVGIYIGNNRFIHAPSSGKEVRTDDLGFAYWAKRFTGARRAVLAAAEPAPSDPATF